MATFPSPPTDALAAGGWCERERRERTAFDAKVVTVDAATVVYEDVDLRERLREATGVDGLWRFFVASRLTLSPASAPSRALTSLVANRSHAGFADILRERGFEGVRRHDDPDADLGGDTTLAGYEALCRLDGVAVRARGWAGVRPVERSYLLVGGAYPTAVRDAPAEDVRSAIVSELDVDEFQSELFELMRATE